MLESAFQTDTRTEIETRTAALGLWGGGSVSLHFAVFDSNCLKSHSTSLRLIVIVLKVVAAKTNLQEKIYGIQV